MVQIQKGCVGRAEKVAVNEMRPSLYFRGCYLEIKLTINACLHITYLP